MKNFAIEVQLRWSDLDPNFHIRHSVYYDWGALCRIEFLYKYGLTADIMQRLNFGPIIFREECVFKKEIKIGDLVSIDLELLNSKNDFSRWSIQHTIRKKENKAAIITIDGAWMNTTQRKLTTPPSEGQTVFNEMPRHSSFQWTD